MQTNYVLLIVLLEWARRTSFVDNNLHHLSVPKEGAQGLQRVVVVGAKERVSLELESRGCWQQRRM